MLKGASEMKYKNLLLMVFFILAGVVLASLTSELIAGIPALEWLTRGAQVSIGNVSGGESALFNFSIIKLNFGLEMSVNVIHVIFITAALFLYKKLK